MNRQDLRKANAKTDSTGLSLPKMSSVTKSSRVPWRAWPCILFVVAAVFLAYQPIWHAGFIWDDDQYVTSNSTLRTLAGLRHIWFEPGATPQYYPLTFTSFWAEYHLWGLNPLGYHLTNVLLHALNALLLWLVLRRMRVPGAALAAAIFALHPVCVESVAWVTERKNTLSGFFFLGSALAALRFWLPQEWNSKSSPEHGAGDGCRSWKFWGLALALYVCALCSKTAALALPAVILLIVWWRRGQPGWREVYPLAPFAAAGVAMGLITWLVERRLGAAGQAYGFSGLERALVAGRALWFYLGKLFWPHPLIFIYPRWNIEARQILAHLPLLAAVGVLGLLWWKRDGWGRPLLVAFAYYLALLALVLGFFNIFYFRFSLVADHFQYLASFGPLALAAAGVTIAFDRWQKGSRYLKPAVCGALLFVLGFLTWQQCRIYTDAETLWRMTLERNPRAYLGYNNLGDLRLLKGQVREAAANYAKALEIQPDYPVSHNNLGYILLHQGQVNEAIIHFQQALEAQPDYANARNNLGLALAQAGRLDQALLQFQRVLEANPGSAIAHYNLGNALFQSGRVEEAIGHYEKALEAAPGSAEVHFNLAMALRNRGQVEQANNHYRKALELQPGLTNAPANPSLPPGT